MTEAPARRWAIKAAALVPFVVSLSCDEATAPQPPLPLPMTDWIAFESDRDDPLGDIYAMTFDGADVRRLTSSSVGETCPRISPDGNWIAYYVHAEADTDFALWLMRANGTEPRPLAVLGVPFRCPIWSRESDAIQTTVVLPGSPDNGTPTRSQVFNLAGLELARFQTVAATLTAFSADGTELLGQWSDCSANGCTQPDIAIRKLDGSGHRWLTGMVATGGFIHEGARDPSSGPDGATVVYICNNSLGQSLNVVCTIKWDGTGKTRIVDEGWASPKFSPNGERVSFLCPQGGSSDLCAIDIDGTNRLRWAANASREGAAWTPDGSSLVFVCGPKDICLIHSDVGTLTNLTQGHGTNANPSMAATVSQ